MASNYPSGLDNFSTTHTDTGSDIIHASYINDLDDAVNKIEAALGANPQQGTLPTGLYSTLAARLNALDNPPVNFQNNVSSYTLVLADLGQIINMFSTTLTTMTVVIPPHSSQPFPLAGSVTVRMGGTATVNFSAGTGVTLNSRGGATSIAGRYGYATLIQMSVLDSWDLTGDVA